MGHFASGWRELLRKGDVSAYRLTAMQERRGQSTVFGARAVRITATLMAKYTRGIHRATHRLDEEIISARQITSRRTIRGL